MTLPSSGPISMAQMRNEYGLGNPVSMSQFYGKNGLPGSGPIRFSDFYGKSNIADQQQLTTGFYQYHLYNHYGFLAGEGGALTDGTANMYGGSSVILLHWNAMTNKVEYSVDGNQPNNGWEQMEIVGQTILYRGNAAYSQIGGRTSWVWPVSGNPFGFRGEQRTIVWK